MTETNIRIIEPGVDLSLDVRVCELSGQDINPKRYENACDVLRSRGIAAVPSAGRILILAPRLSEIISLGDENWQVKVSDTGQSKTLTFNNSMDAPLMARLLERRLIITTTRQKKWWKLDSTRIWYEKEPFQKENDVAAYRRFEISCSVIADVGIGLVVDVGTAFFTTTSVAYYFQPNLPEQNRAERLHLFERLSKRQKGQKATLLYDSGNIRTKCYFEKVNAGEICGTTGEIVVKRKVYSSLYEYYKTQQPSPRISENDPVARVSFPNIDNAVPVASTRLYLRVMNDALPARFGNVDKIAPRDRCELIQRFWTALGDRPLGDKYPLLRPGFWKPEAGRTGRCNYPGLLFGCNEVLSVPTDADLKENIKYFHNRMKFLNQKGCFNVPPAIPREIHLAVPDSLDPDMTQDLGDAISVLLSKWTRNKIAIIATKPYPNLSKGLEMLKSEARSGIALFVFENQDPVDYYKVSSELKNWRVKRITVNQLKTTHINYIRFKGVKDERGRSHRYERAWRAFTEMCALDLLQQMDCVPWRPSSNMNYDAHLAIDVGRDRHFFAVSLFICRPMDKQPHFWIDSNIEIKADSRKETINEVHLKDSIVTLFRKAKRKRFDTLASLLVLRDGRESGRELEGIKTAKSNLVNEGFLAADATVDLVDFHKNSMKGIRLWDTNARGTDNVFEGTYVLLNAKDAVLANTGYLTLNQGTAGAVMISARTEGLQMCDVLNDIHTSSHLNWSSPRVAQTLPIELKRTDEQLDNRTSQEIKRIR